MREYFDKYECNRGFNFIKVDHLISLSTGLFFYPGEFVEGGYSENQLWDEIITIHYMQVMKNEPMKYK